MCQKEKLLVLINFFFCHYAFKKQSAAEASESVYMRERVKSHLLQIFCIWERVNCFLWQGRKKPKNAWLVLFLGGRGLLLRNEIISTSVQTSFQSFWSDRDKVRLNIHSFLLLLLSVQYIFLISLTHQICSRHPYYL